MSHTQTPLFHVVSALSGFFFALGLGISGMLNPQKVIGFLDITSMERWDPALMWVMCGAIAVFGLFQVLGKNLPKPWFSPHWDHIPPRTSNLQSLRSTTLIGNLLFGMGWGLAGYCPGPALVSLASLEAKPAIFTLSMVAGFLIFEGVSKLKWKSARTQAAAP